MNLRAKTPKPNFINRVYRAEYKESVKDRETVKARVQNIAWPSEAMAQVDSTPIGACKRSTFYKIIGAKPSDPPGVRSKHIFEAGIMYEHLQIAKFKAFDMYLEDQLPMEFEVPGSTNKVVVSGKVDVIINDKGIIKAIEIKSVSAYKAPVVMGSDRVAPLPSPKNLMQAMLYKYYFSHVEAGKRHKVEEQYLMYVNRSDGSIFFYRIDLDPEGWAVITAIDEVGNDIYTVNVKNFPTFTGLEARAGNATSEESRQAELRINIHDIFRKFDDTYSYATEKMLPPPDYKHVYSEQDVEREHKIGRLSKIKYNRYKKGTETLGDSECAYCAYQKQCLKDSGITLK